MLSSGELTELRGSSASVPPELPPMDRKVKKPLMEKRRRARINGCLGELKDLLTEALQRDAAATSKLEKADILEMTVHLLRGLHRHRLAVAAQLSPRVMARFQQGWDDCQAQVLHYAGSASGLDSGLRGRLEAHLGRCQASLAAHRLALRAAPTGPHNPSAALHRPAFPFPHHGKREGQSGEDKDEPPSKVWRPW